MLQAYGLSYEPSPLVGKLFDNLDLSLSKGEKVALVGRNGCGKTKLLQILAGCLTPSEGKVILPHGSVAGYLPQDFDLSFQGSCQAFLDEGAEPDRWAAVSAQASKLGISREVRERPFSSLSVGEQMRAAIARILGIEPTVLLLDEPTNHLDIDAREWLESYLSGCPLAVLMVCHDRTVVNSVVSRVLELEGGVLHSWTGNYDDMTRQKAAQRDGQMRQWVKQTAEERRLRHMADHARQAAAKVAKKPAGNRYDAFSKPFYEAKAAKVAKRIQATFKRIESAIPDRVDKPRADDDLRLTFPNCPPLRSSPSVSVRDVTKAYGSRELYRGLCLDLCPSQRVAVTGPNGCGKTTLFRLIQGKERPDLGSIERAPDVRIAYLSQHRAALPADSWILDALGTERPDDILFARTALGRLGIRGNGIQNRIGQLSVGERTKVELVSVMLQRANLLILDEPTNHLEVEAVEALEGAICDYPGAVIFASHDRSFVSNVADEIVELHANPC